MSCQVSSVIVSSVIASEAKQSPATGSYLGIIQEIATAFGLAMTKACASLQACHDSSSLCSQSYMIL